MTDKEKRELKNGIISIFKRFNILDHTATIGGLRNDIIRYINSLQEEPCNSCQGFNDKDKCDELVFTHNCPIVKNPVSIWHDVNRETPTGFGKAIIVLCRNKNMEDGIWLADLIQDWEGEWEPRTNWETPVKWTYVKDLINLIPSEATNMGEQEPASEDLGNYINELSKQFPEVSFAKLSRIAVHVANWQKEQLMKNAIELPLYLDGDFLTVDYDFTESGYKVGDKVKLIIIKEE